MDRRRMCAVNPFGSVPDRNAGAEVDQSAPVIFTGDLKSRGATLGFAVTLVH